MPQKVLIMGAGHQGLTMAAHLGANGIPCYLWNRTAEHMKEIMRTGTVKCSGILKGEIRVAGASTILKDVLQKVIMVTTPSSAHRDIAKILAGYVDNTYTVILNPGRTFGALEFTHVLQEHGCSSLPLIAETQTIVYTCRRDESNGVTLYALKEGVKIAACDRQDTERVLSDLPECIRDHFIPAQSFVETSLGNVGMILHCVPVLMNVGWIEHKKADFKYYYDGISPTIAGILEQLDDERLAIAAAMGYPVESLSAWLLRTYPTHGDNLFELLQNNVCYHKIDAPISIHHRYIEEDVPNGLVPLESAGICLGVKTPVTTTVIDFANLVMHTDYRQSGRNYARLVGLPDDEMRRGVSK